MRSELAKGMGTPMRSAPLVVGHVIASGEGKGAGGMKLASGDGVSGVAVLVSDTVLSVPSTTKCQGLPCQWLKRTNSRTPLPATSSATARSCVMRRKCEASAASLPPLRSKVLRMYARAPSCNDGHWSHIR